MRTEKANCQHHDLHRAAIVDEQGKETPITEAMIQNACEQLDKAWHYPVPQHNQRARP